MSTSRIELAYEQILTEFAAIKTASGYRTDPTISRVIRPIEKISEFPEIGIELGESGISVEDAGITVFNEHVPIYVVGAVSAALDSDGTGSTIRAAAEALGHDMKRVAVALLKKYIVQSTGAKAWTIEFTPETSKLKLLRFLWLDEQRAYGNIQLEFTIVIRNEDTTFV